MKKLSLLLSLFSINCIADVNCNLTVSYLPEDIFNYDALIGEEISFTNYYISKLTTTSHAEFKIKNEYHDFKVKVELSIDAKTDEVRKYKVYDSFGIIFDGHLRTFDPDNILLGYKTLKGHHIAVKCKKIY